MSRSPDACQDGPAWPVQSGPGPALVAVRALELEPGLEPVLAPDWHSTPAMQLRSSLVPPRSALPSARPVAAVGVVVVVVAADVAIDDAAAEAPVDVADGSDLDPVAARSHSDPLPPWPADVEPIEHNTPPKPPHVRPVDEQRGRHLQILDPGPELVAIRS
jgi:hypothetical protein